MGWNVSIDDFGEAYDKWSPNSRFAKIDTETDLTLSNGKSLYAYFNVDITDYADSSEWEFDWNKIDVVDEKDNEVYGEKVGDFSSLSKDEEEELYLNLEKCLYKKDREKQIEWSNWS